MDRSADGSANRGRKTVGTGEMSRRGRGEGSIYRRQDGRWAAAISLGWSGGRRRRKTFYGQTRAEVAKEVACKQSRQLGVTAFVGELTPPRFQVAL
jgi:integrase